MNVWQLPPIHHLSRRDPYFAIEPNDKAIYVESSKDINCLEADTLTMADSGSFLLKDDQTEERVLLNWSIGTRSVNNLRRVLMVARSRAAAKPFRTDYGSSKSEKIYFLLYLHCFRYKMYWEFKSKTFQVMMTKRESL